MLPDWLVCALVLALLSAGQMLTLQALVPYTLENLGLPYAYGAGALALYGATATLFGLVASRSLDVLPLAPCALGGLVVAALARTGLAGYAQASALPILAALLVLCAGADALWSMSLHLLLQRVLDADERQLVDALVAVHRELPATDTTPHEATARVRTRRIYAGYYAGSNLGTFGLAMAYGLARTLLSPQLAWANQLAMAAGAFLSVPVGVVLLGVSFPRWRGYARPTSGAPALADAAQSAPGPWWRDAQLWRFTTVCVLLVGVRTLFVHMNATLTVTMQRAMATPDAPFAYIQGLNPLLIALLVPLLQMWLLRRVPDYALFVLGTTVSALAVLAVALGDPSALWPYIVFVALFTVGEAVWSARFDAYAKDATPPAHRAVYTAVARAPTFVAALLASLLSATLVAQYCPGAGPSVPVLLLEPEAVPPPPLGPSLLGDEQACYVTGLWGVIFLLAALTPLGLLVGTPWLRPRVRKEAPVPVEEDLDNDAVPLVTAPYAQRGRKQEDDEESLQLGSKRSVWDRVVGRLRAAKQTLYV